MYKKTIFILLNVFLIFTFWNEKYAQNAIEDKLTIKESIKKFEKDLSTKPSDFYILKTLGILYHNLARLEEKNASHKAVDYLTKANELSHNEDAETLAYLGSSYTLKGRDAETSVLKMTYVNKGCNLIDKAVKLAPRNVAVRMVRVYNSLALPSIFKRLKFAEEDCLFLLNSYEKKQMELNKELLSETYFNLAEVYYRKNNITKAKYYWERSIETSANTPFASYSKERIEKLKSIK
ncbi:MAG: hypothetical protein N2643_05475 [Endomicrobia bacterium]|nr:hypothetical protein [Endomicrobiia bacterium]